MATQERFLVQSAKIHTLWLQKQSSTLFRIEIQRTSNRQTHQGQCQSGETMPGNLRVLPLLDSNQERTKLLRRKQ